MFRNNEHILTFFFPYIKNKIVRILKVKYNAGFLRPFRVGKALRNLPQVFGSDKRMKTQASPHQEMQFMCHS